MDGSSERNIGKNVTRKTTILHQDKHALHFIEDGSANYFSLIEHDFLSYMPASSFPIKPLNYAVISSMSAGISNNDSWHNLRHIVDKGSQTRLRSSKSY